MVSFTSGFAMLDGLARMRFCIIPLRLVCNVSLFCSSLNSFLFLVYISGSILLSAAYIWSQLLSCHGMQWYNVLVNSSSHVFYSVYSCFEFCLWSKFAIATWSWRTHCWTEVLHLAWKFVTSDTQRYDECCLLLPFSVLRSLLMHFGFLTVFCSSLTTKINSWHSCLHCTGGTTSSGIWWQGNIAS